VIDSPAMTKKQISKLAVAVVLAGALMGGCGSTEETPSPGGGSTGSEDSFEDYQLAFAECMREHGIDLPDPSGDGSMTAPAIKDMDAFTAASGKCQEKLGQPPAREGGPTKSDEEQLAEMVAIAECFREHGIEVPDPKAGEIVSIPMDAPTDVLEACAPDGISGPAGPGGN
jgi:hypothetical protein